MEAAYVYRLAGALGSELQRLSDRFGPGALAELVSQVVRLLEVLESLAAAAGDLGRAPEWARGLLEEAPSDPEPAAAAAAAAAQRSLQVAEQQLAEAQQRERRLQSRLAQVEEEQQRALSLLAGGQALEDSTLRKERAVMLQLKEVVDYQRDKIRAQDHEIQCKVQDTEALQEQLSRLMAMNENLRQKLAIVQAQLRSALEKKAEVEARWEAEGRGRAAEPMRTGTTMVRGGDGAQEQEEEEEEEEGRVAAAAPGHLPAQRTFSKEELQQILQERNELKTSLFLVQEELAYYQRELLNDERVPALLLDAVKSAIKKQRKKIWAKMLGTEEEQPPSREEEEGEAWLTDPPGADRTDGCLPESRIKSFFSQWYHRAPQPSPTEGSPGTWEIIGTEDVAPGEEGREEKGPPGSSPPGRASPLP